MATQLLNPSPSAAHSARVGEAGFGSGSGSGLDSLLTPVPPFTRLQVAALELIKGCRNYIKGQQRGGDDAAQDNHPK